MTLRSYILPYSGKVLDPSNAAGGDVGLVDSCEAATSCAACVGYLYEGHAGQTLRCDWLPFTRQCVAANTSRPSVLTTRSCGSPRPELAKGLGDIGPVGDIDILDFSKPIGLLLIVGAGLVVCSGCWQVYLFRSDREALNVHLDMDGSLARQESRYTEARRRDTRMLHKRKVPRKRDGQVEYQEEVMTARLEDPNTPYHLMDPETLLMHYQRHGFASTGH